MFGKRTTGRKILLEMSKRCLTLASAIAASMLLGTTGCHNVSRDSVDANRSQCRRSLRSLEIAVKAYLSDNDGHSPRTLDDALSNIGFPDAEKAARTLRCPGLNGRAAVGTDVAARMGFRFIDWSKWFGETNTPPDYFPLIYDASLQNHEGKGVNVVSVGARIWWDEGAGWLRDFAAKHQEYHLALPE
jgi:hypothetical protein